MKKVCLLLLMLLTLAACGGRVDEAYANGENGFEEAPYEYETIDPIQRLIAEDKEDLAHFTRIFESVFARFGSIYRQLGIDVLEIIEPTVHPVLERRHAIGQHSLEAGMNDLGRRLQGSGHIATFDEFSYRFALTNLYRQRAEYGPGFVPSLLWQYRYDIYRSEAAMRRFGDIEIDLNYFGDSGAASSIRTEIIEEGRIARVLINWLNTRNIESDRQIALEFFHEIRDFEHLIIDIQGSPGGDPHYFVEVIMQPLIAQPKQGEFYAFVRSSPYSAALVAGFVEYEGLQSAIPAAEFVQSRDMPYFVMEDLAELDYVIPRQINIQPAADSANFSGQVWLLTDGRTISGAATAAKIAKYTDFATLVGSTTRGTFSQMMAQVVVPNSGSIIQFDMSYITNAAGRHLQELGVEPHYNNRIRMTAMQTVVDMISERVE
ncbi:MAG: hypothetical protein LBE35_09575 [Clostridiales bacterium]|jgi:hypothetical protein|nr:hypothetical protein [Clostridiales bacterium]